MSLKSYVLCKNPHAFSSHALTSVRLGQLNFSALLAGENARVLSRHSGGVKIVNFSDTFLISIFQQITLKDNLSETLRLPPGSKLGF